MAAGHKLLILVACLSQKFGSEFPGQDTGPGRSGVFRPLAGFAGIGPIAALALLGLSPGEILPQGGCLARPALSLGALAVAFLGRRLSPGNWFSHGARLARPCPPGQAPRCGGRVAKSGRRACCGSPSRPLVDNPGKQARIAGEAAGLHQTYQPDSQLSHSKPPSTRPLASLEGLLIPPHDLAVAG